MKGRGVGAGRRLPGGLARGGSFGGAVVVAGFVGSRVALGSEPTAVGPDSFGMPLQRARARARASPRRRAGADQPVHAAASPHPAVNSTPLRLCASARDKWTVPEPPAVSPSRRRAFVPRPLIHLCGFAPWREPRMTVVDPPAVPPSRRRAPIPRPTQPLCVYAPLRETNRRPPSRWQFRRRGGESPSRGPSLIFAPSRLGESPKRQSSTRRPSRHPGGESPSRGQTDPSASLRLCERQIDGLRAAGSLAVEAASLHPAAPHSSLRLRALARAQWTAVARCQSVRRRRRWATRSTRRVSETFSMRSMV